MGEGGGGTKHGNIKKKERKKEKGGRLVHESIAERSKTLIKTVTTAGCAGMYLDPLPDTSRLFVKPPSTEVPCLGQDLLPLPLSNPGDLCDEEERN